MIDNIPDKIRVCFSIALLGEIYPEIRAIAVKYDEQDKSLLIRYYLDRKPIEDDFENISILATEIEAAFGNFLKICETECIYSDKPIGRLDYLDGWVYARKE
jgi:hypothetical protein